MNFLKPTIFQTKLNQGVFKTVLLGLGLLAISNSVLSDTTNWKYFASGAAPYYNDNGLPNGLVDKLSYIPTDLLSRIETRLPEGRNIATDPLASAMLADDKGANLPIKTEADVWVVYLTEGAGYQNSVGYFTFDTTALDTVNLPAIQSEEYIIFPRFINSVLRAGQAVYLGKIPAGKSIGFTIAANAWDANSKVVSPNRSFLQIFRTFQRFNPEYAANKSLAAHTILFSDVNNGLFVLGFEDLNREAMFNNDWPVLPDHDFNDVLIAILVDPGKVDVCHIADLTSGQTDPNCPPTNNPSNTNPTPGESGPVLWRELNAPPPVNDTVKKARAEARATPPQ